jgi:hypothetical protein
LQRNLNLHTGATALPGHVNSYIFDGFYSLPTCQRVDVW